MTNPNLTEIIFLIDRSGSMSNIRTDMVGGMQSFVDEQKKLPDPCVVSVYQFDDKYDVLFEERAIGDVKLDLEPRGMTALNDALGRSINDVGARLRRKPEAERPGKVVFVVVTDGFENASREFTAKQVKDLVTEQKDKYAWQFAFLGANIDSFAVGGGYGISGASTMDYEASSAGVKRGYAVLSNAVATYRSAVTGSATLDFAPAIQKVDGEDEE